MLFMKLLKPLFLRVVVGLPSPEKRFGLMIPFSFGGVVSMI